MIYTKEDIDYRQTQRMCGQTIWRHRGIANYIEAKEKILEQINPSHVPEGLYSAQNLNFPASITTKWQTSAVCGTLLQQTWLKSRWAKSWSCSLPKPGSWSALFTLGTSGEPQLCCGGVFLQSKRIASRSGGSVYFSPCLPLTSLRPLSRQISSWEGSWHPQSVAGKNPRRHLEALSGLMLGETMGSTEASRALRLALPASQLLAPQPSPGIPKARDRLLRQVESHLKKTNSKYTSHALNLWSDCESIIA